MPKNPFRARPEVQADVLRWTLEGRPVSEVTNFLQEKYGKAYRKQNLLEDMRFYLQRQKDEEKARKAIPRKYRKEEDKREHLLIYMTDERKQAGDSDFVRLRPTNVQTVEKELKYVKEILGEPISQTRIYFSVHTSIGTKQNLEVKLQMARQFSNVQYWSIIPTNDSARILRTLSNFSVSRHSTRPWIEGLYTLGSTSKVSSFQKLVKKVLT